MPIPYIPNRYGFLLNHLPGAGGTTQTMHSKLSVIMRGDVHPNPATKRAGLKFLYYTRHSLHPKHIRNNVSAESPGYFLQLMIEVQSLLCMPLCDIWVSI